MAMTGYFAKVEIPDKVKVGENIPIYVEYYAKNDGAQYWSVCVMAKISGTIFVLPPDKTSGEVAQGSREATLGKMPSENVLVKVRLLGHDEYWHGWTTADWRE